jgi:hypothetical protein
MHRDRFKGKILGKTAWAFWISVQGNRKRERERARRDVENGLADGLRIRE